MKYLGFAEMLKHGIISNKKILQTLKELILI